MVVDQPVQLLKCGLHMFCNFLMIDWLGVNNEWLVYQLINDFIPD